MDAPCCGRYRAIIPVPFHLYICSLVTLANLKITLMNLTMTLANLTRTLRPLTQVVYYTKKFPVGEGDVALP